MFYNNLLLENFFGKAISGGEVLRAARGANPPLINVMATEMVVVIFKVFLGFQRSPLGHLNGPKPRENISPMMSCT